MITSGSGSCVYIRDHLQLQGISRQGPGTGWRFTREGWYHEGLGHSVAASLSTGTRVGEYEITGLLGAGAMGTVYAGVHPIIGKRVAIKVLQSALSADARMVDRFVREARAVVKIQHRNIVDVFAFGYQADVGHYFVMPFLDGEALANRIAKRGPMAPAEALPIVEQIADALDAAHGEGILHRDLKPDNVFLARTRDGGDSVRVLDFGLAKLIDGEVSSTQAGAQMGTPLFMSPEQWDGATVDHRTDIYAFGVLVHNLLTGRYPFESASPVALMNMHANQEPMPPSTYGADPAADAVIARALAKDPEYRFASAGSLYQALWGAIGPGAAAAAAPAPIGLRAAGAPTLDRGSYAPPRSRPWVGAIVAAVVLAAASVIVIAVTAGGSGGASAPDSDASLPAATTIRAALDAGVHDARGAAATPPPAADAAPTRGPAARTETRRRRPAPAARPVTRPEPTDKPDPPSDEGKTKWGDTVKPF